MKGFGYKNIQKKLPKYVSKEVIDTMLYKAKKDRYRNFIIIMTLWKTGLRVNELANLHKCDLQDDCIFVKEGKGKKDRIVPLESELGNLLGLYSDRLNQKDRLFDILDRQIRNVVYKYAPEDLNIHPQTLRHNFAVHCLKKDMNLRSLQKILGHASLTQTQVYLDVVGKDIKEDFKRVDW